MIFMKIIEVKQLAIPDIKVIKYQRFMDDRGYFTETFRYSDIQQNPQAFFLKDIKFTQFNESRSVKGVIKGMHFQWNPYMYKLVRVQNGHMVDFFADIRKGSPNFGKVVAYNIPARETDDFNEWIWIPVGFAHGNFYLEDTTIEYFCTGQWAPDTERGISPLAPDLDWSLCDPALKQQFDELVKSGPIMTDKDKNGMTLEQWKNSPEAENFTYSS
jgi:dTDP-4-dehydrorhamnose 3,5-epimerase